jgi:hypothetical protein
MFLRMHGSDGEHPGSSATCQEVHRAFPAPAARHAVTIVCGSAEFFHLTGKLVEQLAAEDLAFDGEPTALAIVEEYSFLSEFLPEYVILSEEVVDDDLLPAIDPASEDQKQQLPRLKLRFHVPPAARLRSGASGIVGYMSSVARRATSVRDKIRRYSCLRLG